MIIVDLERQVTDEENKDPEFLRNLASEAKEKALELIAFADTAERRASSIEQRTECEQLARELKENFDEAKLEAYVTKQKERLAVAQK